MSTSLPLKSVHTKCSYASGENCFVTIWIIGSNVSNRCSYSRKVHGSGTTALIISNEKLEDIIKIVKLLKESGLLIKRISETIKNEAKEQKSRFPLMLLGTLAASTLGNALAGKVEITAGEGARV